MNPEQLELPFEPVHDLGEKALEEAVEAWNTAQEEGHYYLVISMTAELMKKHGVLKVSKDILEMFEDPKEC